MCRALIDHETARLQARLDPTAPGHGTHPRREFAHGERLHDVVVGAEFESHDAIGLVTASRRDDHRDVRRAAKLSQDLEPITVGQTQIQQDDIDILRRQHDLAGVHDVLGLDPIALKTGQQWLSDSRVVLDDKHLSCLHRGTSAPEGIARSPSARRDSYSRFTSAWTDLVGGSLPSVLHEEPQLHLARTDHAT